MNTIEILTAARALIEDERNWGQGIRPYRANRTSCCAIEAIDEAYYNAPQEARRAAYRALADAIGIEKDIKILDWNDALTRKHADVLAAFDKALEAERAKTSQSSAQGFHR